jgi:hypothetical protein
LEPRRKNRPCSYKTASGRPYWPSRDPIEEEGGINVYVFCYNEPGGWIDAFGLLGIDEFETALKEICKNKNKGNAADLLREMRGIYDLSDDKYILTREFGVIDATHFVNGANVMLRNMNMTPDIYMDGGKYKDENGKEINFAGRIKAEKMGDIDVEDNPSDYLGALLGDKLRKNKIYVDGGKVKECDCLNLINELISELKKQGALDKADQDKYLDKKGFNGSNFEGGRMGYYVRDVLPGGRKNISPSKIPFRQAEIKDSIWKHLGK